jgi:hypothetical protein
MTLPLLLGEGVIRIKHLLSSDGKRVLMAFRDFRLNG